MNVVLVFNKSDRDCYPDGFPYINDEVLFKRKQFCWNAASAGIRRWTQFEGGRLPEIKEEGLLLVNDGYGAYKVSLKDQVVREIKEKIDKSATFYVCFHQNSERDWKPLFSKEGFPLNTSRIHNFSNGDRVGIKNQLFHFYQGKIGLDEFIRKAFGESSYKENISILYSCLSPTELGAVEKKLSDRSEEVKQKFSKLMDAGDGPAGPKYFKAFSEFRNALFT